MTATRSLEFGDGDWARAAVSAVAERVAADRVAADDDWRKWRRVVMGVVSRQRTRADGNGQAKLGILVLGKNSERRGIDSRRECLMMVAGRRLIPCHPN